MMIKIGVNNKILLLIRSLSNLGKKNLDEKELREIKEGLEDIEHGRTYSIEYVAKELGITLK